MTTYIIEVESPGGNHSVLMTHDRYLADITFDGLNRTLARGYKITLNSLNTTECLAVRNTWEDRKTGATE